MIILNIIKNIILSAIGFSILLLIGFFIYVGIIIAFKPPSLAQNSHDAIIVLTGDKGRIEQSFELLLDNKADKLLISGVLKNMRRDDVINNNTQNLSPLQRRQLKNHCCIMLDDVAITTETNASESRKWVKTNNIESFILVTSDYHMPRSYIQFHKNIDNNVIITVYPVRTQSRVNQLLSLRFWQNCIHEYIKFGGSLIRLERQNAF